MSAKITYQLNQNGRKASILAGGDGKEEQTILVGRDDPNFARVVARGSVGSDGTVKLNIDYWTRSFDGPQTADTLLAFLDEKDAAAKAKADAEVAAKRAETLAVLTERRTTKNDDSFGVGRDGQPQSGGFIIAKTKYETPAWPYQASKDVTDSPEAVAWVAELQAARDASYQVALEEARAKLPDLLAAENAEKEAAAARAAALAARKVVLGGDPADYLCRVENGALVNVPCYEGHKRGKNWLATICPDPQAPGGLSRRFAERARGDAYYILPDLNVGEAVEFGADYYSGGGRKSTDRWYGFVVAVTGEALLLRKAATGKAAHKAGQEWAKTHGPAPIEEAIEQGMARINGEGSIEPSVN